MKLTTLSEKLLKQMYREYKKTDNTTFVFKTFEESFPNESNDKISQALYLLEQRELIHIEAFDNVAYFSFLLPEGISFCEKNSGFKKCFDAILEIIKLFK